MASVSGLNDSQPNRAKSSKITSPQAPADTRTDVYTGGVRPEHFPGLPEGWTSNWELFPSADGSTQLFGVHHHREPWQGHRMLIVVHGHGEHGGRYFHVPHYVRDVVDSVYIFDLRGHGRSNGLRGHIENFDDFCADVAQVIRHKHELLMARFGKAEIHVLGHSLGGHLVIRTALLHADLPIQSITATAPFLGIKAKVPAHKKVGARVLNRVWSSLQLSTGLDPAAISHDQEIVRLYQQDRLVHDKMTPRFYAGVQAAMSDTMSRHSGVEYPLQIVVPLQDEIVDAEKSLAFFRNLKHRHKRLRTYPGFFHEPMNEVGKEPVFEDIVSWISQHSGSAEDRPTVDAVEE